MNNSIIEKLDYVKSLCSEMSKMIDNKNIDSDVNNIIDNGIDKIENVFFKLINDINENVMNKISEQKTTFISEITDNEIKSDGVAIRKFTHDTCSDSLDWHLSKQRISLISLRDSDWKIQIDNKLPVKISKYETYEIDKGEYYRLISGDDELYLKIRLLKTKTNSFTFKNPNIAEIFKYHIDNNISFSNNIFRPGSDAFERTKSSADFLIKKGKIKLNQYDYN